MNKGEEAHPESYIPHKALSALIGPKEMSSALTHFPLADCLAVILSVSLRPVSRSWRPDTEPVCVAVCGFQKETSPFRVATASS